MYNISSLSPFVLFPNSPKYTSIRCSHPLHNRSTNHTCSLLSLQPFPITSTPARSSNPLKNASINYLAHLVRAWVVTSHSEATLRWVPSQTSNAKTLFISTELLASAKNSPRNLFPFILSALISLCFRNRCIPTQHGQPPDIHLNHDTRHHTKLFQKCTSRAKYVTKELPRGYSPLLENL